MFTRRHEQELAEIRELTAALDQRAREAQMQVGRIHERYVFYDAHSEVALPDPGTGNRWVLEHAGIWEAIEALAARHQLAAGVADGLQSLVWLVDWGRANFVPAYAEGDAEADARGLRSASRRTALTTLAESLSGLELEPVREARRIADIGSGAGFPGLVLAVARPDAHVTLIEKVPGRCAFLRRASELLGLDNVAVIEGTVQEWSAGAGACDVVTSRKVGRIETMVEWSAPLLRPGGSVALWPGTSDFAEVEPGTAADAAEAAGLRLAQVLPLHSENRHGQPVVKHLYVFERA